MRTPSDSLSMNGASARYTVRTDEVADQGRPWGPRSASSPASSSAAPGPRAESWATTERSARNQCSGNAAPSSGA
jgi:hypothetical protein